MKGLIRKAALILGCAVGAAGIGCATTSHCSSCGNDGAGGGGGGRGGAYGRGALGRNGALAGAAAGLGQSDATLGCSSNKDLYDRCYPERYNNLAVRSVNLAFTPQVQNGHVLDQTIWNHHFEKGGDKLTGGGLAQLQYLSRRRPTPDTTLYLATANDLDYDPCCPERYAGAQSELNSLRLAAVRKYLAAINTGRPLDFQVLLHDPTDVTINSGGGGLNPVSGALTGMNASYRGSLSGGGGGGGGTAGPSGSGIGSAAAR